MSRIILLDAGPLGMLAHPKPAPEIVAWLRRLVQEQVRVIVPEIADYELRRELLRIGSVKSIERLNELKNDLDYLPLTTSTMLKAAELWAEARRHGRPTADNKALDGDMILCTQAAIISRPEDEVIIATTNVGHLSHFSQAKLWKDI
ncbi:MAG TPA: PIN domain-containing protein [Ktedonobacterales bacterium]|jgi:predicted nucleic acid-binding protein